MSEKPIDYINYLKIDEITSLQELISEKHGNTAHIEMLYIIVHQVYELWFKVIIHEVDSVIEMFQEEYVDERNIGRAVARLNRIRQIQPLLIEQIGVLETMTPLQFLDFRKYLGTASGFQSFQFRLLENKLGLPRSVRMAYGGKQYIDEFDGEKARRLEEAERSPSLVDVVGRWLERTPFLRFESFHFEQEYEKTITRMLDEEETQIRGNSALGTNDQERMLQGVAANRESFLRFLNRSEHEQLIEKGFRRFSFDAMLAALFIMLYRHEPILHMPSQLLELVTDIDENFTNWRSRHALMVHRMLGKKMGTGESSGYDYLRRTIERHRVFTDLFDLSTYLIPRSELPELPAEMRKGLAFHHSVQEGKL